MLGGRPDSMVRTPASLLVWPAGGILDIREAYRVKFATGLPRETNDVSRTAGDEGSRLACDSLFTSISSSCFMQASPPATERPLYKTGTPADELASRSLNSRPDAGLGLSELRVPVTRVRAANRRDVLSCRLGHGPTI